MDLLGKYLNDVGLTPLLSADEERELAQAIERGREARARLDAGDLDQALHATVAKADMARHRFIRANLRLVVSIARRYPRSPAMELLDLIQEGNLGLEHAVDRFDWRRGLKFSTYATFWIRQGIRRALNQKANLIRLPDEKAATLRATLRQAAGDTDELDDDAARLHRLTTPTSLDRPVGDQEGHQLLDMLVADSPGPEQVRIDLEDIESLHEQLEALQARARSAVELRFGLVDGRKRSYREIGEQLGVTSEAARRLVKRAVAAVAAHVVTPNRARPSRRRRVRQGVTWIT